MGVPITILGLQYSDGYIHLLDELSNEMRYEIVGMAKRGAGDPALRSKTYTKEDYTNYSDLNAGPTLLVNGVLKNTYPRILIKKI